MSRYAKRIQILLSRKYGSSDYNALTGITKQSFVKVVNMDLTECLKDVSAPTLLIWGENDHETPLAMANIMEAKMQDAAIIVFENGSHFAYIEQAPRFVRIASHFFGEGMDCS